MMLVSRLSMSKRRLSKHQLARISQNQHRELGFDETDSVDAQTSLEKCNGRIISHYGQHVDVESLITGDEGRRIRCTQRSNLPRLVTGDLVVWSDDGADGGVVLALGQRRNFFGRPNPVGSVQGYGCQYRYSARRVRIFSNSSCKPYRSLSRSNRTTATVRRFGFEHKLDLLNQKELI